MGCSSFDLRSLSRALFIDNGIDVPDKALKFRTIGPDDTAIGTL